MAAQVPTCFSVTKGAHQPKPKVSCQAAGVIPPTRSANAGLLMGDSSPEMATARRYRRVLPGKADASSLAQGYRALRPSRLYSVTPRSADCAAGKKAPHHSPTHVRSLILRRPPPVYSHHHHPFLLLRAHPDECCFVVVVVAGFRGVTGANGRSWWSATLLARTRCVHSCLINTAQCCRRNTEPFSANHGSNLESSLHARIMVHPRVVQLVVGAFFDLQESLRCAMYTCS